VSLSRLKKLSKVLRASGALVSVAKHAGFADCGSLVESRDVSMISALRRDNFGISLERQKLALALGALTTTVHCSR